MQSFAAFALALLSGLESLEYQPGREYDPLAPRPMTAPRAKTTHKKTVLLHGYSTYSSRPDTEDDSGGDECGGGRQGDGNAYTRE